MRILFLVLITLASFTGLQAKEKNTVIQINDREIMERLDRVVPVLLEGHPEWNLTELKKNTTETIPQGKTSLISKVKPHTKVMTSEDLYEKSRNSVLIIGNYYDCGHCNKMHVGVSATAAAISEDGLCMTNYHVLEDIITGNEEGTKGTQAYFVATPDGKCYPITEILSYSDEGDAAIFKVDTRGDKLEYAPLGPSAKIGSKVHMIAHPQQMFYYYSEGVVSRNRVDFVKGKEMSRMDISAEYAAGASGGPIFDSCGNIVGMVSSTSTIFYEKEKINTQMVIKSTIPVQVMKDLLAL